MFYEMLRACTLSSLHNVKCTPDKFATFSFQAKRWKSRSTHWATLRKNKAPSDKALEHFDDFYASVFKNSWRSIRVALLSQHKYCAVVNNFSDIQETVTSLENDGAFNMRTVINMQKEKLLESKQEHKKKKDLANIHALDLKLEQLAEQKRYDELRETYSQEERIPNPVLNVKKSSEDANKSDEEQLDWSRQIDTSSGLSASALFEYIPTTKLKGREDWVSESEHYMYYDQKTQLPVEIVPEDELPYPDHLQVYSYEMCNTTRFAPPKRGKTGVYNYYLMNASSLLPVLALSLAPGDRVLDMCAAPGGKSILALQTLYPDRIVCNDSSRTIKLGRTLNSYFYDMSRITITNQDGRSLNEANVFNKILVDVPCTNDRHSVTVDENNIFKGDRLKERFRIPEMQSELLSKALQMVKVGGTVVYSTCSLSPIQNDGVVQMALRKMWQESKCKFIVKDLTTGLEPAKIFYKFDHSYRLKYGHLVVPYLPANYGPLYFCKLVKVQ